MNKLLLRTVILAAIYLLPNYVKADMLCDIGRNSKISYSFLFNCLERVSKSKSSEDAAESLELILSNKDEEAVKSLGKIALPNLENILERSEYLYYKSVFSGFSFEEEESLRQSADSGNHKAAAYLLAFDDKIDKKSKPKYLKIARNKGSWLGAYEYADYLLSLDVKAIDEIKKKSDTPLFQKIIKTAIRQH